MYRALYRKWRPQRFEDVVAQRGIVTALRNQIATGRVGHAYLFTGVRGTGKTSCAKIFAKAVNCLHPQNGDPCGECEICRGIDNGSILEQPTPPAPVIIRYISSTRCTCSPRQRSTPC